MDQESFALAVDAGLCQKNWKLLSDWYTWNSSFSYNYGTADEDEVFDEHIFEIILSLLEKDKFLQDENSFNVLLIFEYDWGLLSDNQKQKLIVALRKAYPQFSSYMAWFVTSELLGEYYANFLSLQALLELKYVDDDEARSVVPFGLENVARYSDDNVVAQKAWAELTKMKSDSSERVRNEAEKSFMRVAAHYGKSSR